MKKSPLIKRAPMESRERPQYLWKRSKGIFQRCRLSGSPVYPKAEDAGEVKRDFPEAPEKVRGCSLLLKVQKELRIRSAHTGAYAPALCRRSDRIRSPAVFTRAASVALV